MTAAPGSGTISLANGALAPALACQVAVTVRGTAAGPKNNVSGAVSSTEGGTGNTASASVVVVAPPSIAKAFGKSVFPLRVDDELDVHDHEPERGHRVVGCGVLGFVAGGVGGEQPERVVEHVWRHGDRGGGERFGVVVGWFASGVGVVRGECVGEGHDGGHEEQHLGGGDLDRGRDR